jgi:hypothetical protein
MKAIKAVLGFVWDVVSFFIELLKFIAGAAKEINEDLTNFNVEAHVARTSARLANENKQRAEALERLRVSKACMAEPYGRK